MAINSLQFFQRIKCLICSGRRLSNSKLGSWCRDEAVTGTASYSITSTTGIKEAAVIQRGCYQ